jgi:hypothetical protein
MSTTPDPTPTPITFVLEDFETEFRLSTNADTYSREIQSQPATFALDVCINLVDFKSLFRFTTDDITLVTDTENDQRLEFITDVRKWGLLKPHFAYLPASSLERSLTTYTTDPNVSAVQAYVSWFTFRITSIKDSAVLIRNVGEIAADMDIRFKNYSWSQELYYKLWKHSMSVTPTKDNTGLDISGSLPDDFVSVYNHNTTDNTYEIHEYPSSTKIVSTVPYSNYWSNGSTLKSSSLNQLMYLTKSTVGDRIAVVPFIDDRNASEVCIAQKIFEQIMFHDPSRIRNAAKVNLLDNSSAVITDISGNSFDNIYEFPLLAGDTIEMKVNVLVNTDNVNSIFDNPNTTMSEYLQQLNTSFNNASTSNSLDEHENYISYLIKLHLYTPV